VGVPRCFLVGGGGPPEAGGEDSGLGGGGGKDKEVREKRELAYWCVLGLGKVDVD